MKPIFYKRHFIALAIFVHDMACTVTTRMQLAHSLADLLGEDNPHFNREKFIEACRGVKSESKASKRTT